MVSGPIDPAASDTTFLDAAKISEETAAEREKTILGGPVKHTMVGHFGRPLNSYAPQFTLNSGKLQRDPSFRKAWYAVGFASDVPYAPLSPEEEAKQAAEAAEGQGWQLPFDSDAGIGLLETNVILGDRERFSPLMVAI